MANPFDDYAPPKNYGSVSGEPSAFSGFEDDTFSRMCRKISNACSEINSQTNELKNLCKRIGGRQDDEDLRQRIFELRKSTFEKVESTTELFNALITQYENTSERERKIAIESLRKNFGRTANEFSQVYERVINRLKDNPRPRVTDSMVGMSQDNEEAAALLETEQQIRAQDQVQVSYAENRANMMENLADDMVQLQDIMSSIQNMVVEQGENIDNIEAHVEHAANEVERGRTQLGAAVRYKRCSRRLTVIIILIVTGVVIAVVVVLLILICGVGHACSKK